MQTIHRQRRPPMRNLTAVTNAKVVTGGKCFNAPVIIDSEKIVSVGTLVPCSFDGKIIDGTGLYLAPGFIDIHTHGAGGHDFMDATVEAFLGACETHSKYGTTLLLPTTLAGDEDELVRTFDSYHEAKKLNKRGAQMYGLHLEGPYFSKEFKGAQDEKYIVSPSRAQYERIYERSRGAIVRWSAAPELDGALAFGEFLQRNGIIASIAHTSATYAQTLAAYNSGFKLITHLYSGMSTITRKDGFRIPGVTESAYIIDGMSAELIADGCHLPPELLLLAYKCKGADKLVLVTDSMRGAGMPQGESILGSLSKGQRVIIEKGVAFMPDRTAFAGSVCTADRLVRTMVKSVGLPVAHAVKMATQTPARILGLSDKKGKIEAGADADLVLFDDNINISKTIIAGNTVFGDKQ